MLRLEPVGSAPAVLRAGAELELCDCEKAASSPDGLSCGKEGWFISSFEREGSWVRRVPAQPTVFFTSFFWLGVF